MKAKIIGLGLALTLLLTGCDAGKEGVIKDIKIDMSTEYQVPMSDVEVETMNYGISKFTTNQFKVTIKSKNVSYYFIAKDGSADNFTRIPVK